MLNFDYSTPTRIYFGKGQIVKLPKEILKYGNRILLAYGKESIKKNGVYNAVTEILKQNQIAFIELKDIKANPTLTSVISGIKLCRDHKLNFILAIGGGSVIDCAKAVASGFYYDGNPWDFYIGKANITQALPLGSVLTLSATGSEMNGNSVITNEDVQLKLATGSELLKPVFSVLNPCYTFSVLPNQTAAGSADIISHCFEQYFSSVKNTYLQDRLTESIIGTCIHFAPIAISEPHNYEARANLMWASSLALNGLLTYGKKGDWATHNIEHELSALFDLTHGIGLAMITPHWMRNVLSEDTVDRFLTYAQNVWKVSEQDKYKAAEEGIKRTYNFFSSISIPMSLGEMGISLNEELIHNMAKKILSVDTIGNAKILKENDIIEILYAIK